MQHGAPQHTGGANATKHTAQPRPDAQPPVPHPLRHAHEEGDQVQHHHGADVGPAQVLLAVVRKDRDNDAVAHQDEQRRDVAEEQ